MTDLITARARLEAGNYTCVLCKGEALFTATERGVKPLVRWLTQGAELRRFSAADLSVLLGVSAVYAHVMSRSAAQVLADNGIHTDYGTLVENITNRQGTGICPFEAAVLDIHDPDTAYAAIREKMVELNITL